MKGSASFETSIPPSFSSNFRALGPTTATCAILLGHVGGVNLPIPPFALQPVFHPGMDAIRPARGGVAQPGILVNPRHNAVIRQEALLVAHQPIAAFADRQRAHHAGVKHVQEPPRIRPLDDDLAKGRGIQQPQHCCGCSAPRDAPPVRGFRRAREAIGPAPQADRLQIGLLRPRASRASACGAAAGKSRPAIPLPARPRSPAYRAGGRWWCPRAESLHSTHQQARPAR